ncbi:MAG: PSD1 and planctomycete cytochrome C domain-containing protein [Verrucomicrobiota bacterium]
MTSIISRFLLAGTLFAANSAFASEGIEFFESKIRPVLAQDCYECHNSNGKAKGKLILDHREPMMKGGSSGPSIIPGNADESLLIQAIRHKFEDLEMPKAGVMLDEAIIEDFVKWVNMGAPDPRDAPPSAAELAEDAGWDAILERRKAWWSFQPIDGEISPPSEGHAVDAFVRRELEKAGLEPSPPAQSHVLARRLYFALTGLPPTPQQIEEFEKKGYEAAVDELLASPHFGEKWARHWMDWIRYAESHGSEGDPKIPNAHLYRDYLIRALNADVPYDQLVREHVAGDLLAKPRLNTELAINESLIGTAHWRMVFHGFAPTDALDEKVRFTDDQINVFTKAFLGLTVSCARCHDHKFDAISQADYYALFGILGSTRPASAAIDLPEKRLVNREALSDLKPVIREAIAADWLAALPESVPPLKIVEHQMSDGGEQWDLSNPDTYKAWFQYGDGLAEKPSEAGEFAVAPQGGKALVDVFPSGVYSNLVSDKSGAVLTSPEVHLDGEYELYVHVRGGGDAMARYVVQNYPRSGTVFKVNSLKDDDKQSGWRWLKFDLGYWNGDDIHIELATARDAALLVKNNDRSWFGIREARLVKKGESGPRPVTQVVDGAALRKAVAAWRGNSISNFEAQIISEAMKRGILSNDTRDLPTAKPLIEKYRELEAAIPVATRIPTLAEWKGRDQPLFDRGDHKKPLEPVSRRFLDAIDNTPYQSKISGRLELADDLFRSDNPFTRRVIVNRIWHHLFGRGLVSTTDNFGRLGVEPTHPELLDYLAIRFEEEDEWSLKSVIRVLVTSETWQQASQPSELAASSDPSNKLLSHANVRRLEAEAIRDQFLAVSGSLDASQFGPPASGTSSRRSVYVSVIRNRMDPFLATFDAPVPFSTKGSRDVTNVPAQSLMLMNDKFVANAAANFARRSDSIEEMWSHALGRSPTTEELTAASDFLESTKQRYQQVEQERTEMVEQIRELKQEMASIKQPVRVRLERELIGEVEAAQNGPEPFAHWKFDDGFRDEMGNLDGTANGTARIEADALVLDGGGFVSTPPLNRAFEAKTLEVLVQLDDLDQRGGGVMTLQDVRGSVFDSIVFAETEKGHWLAGSDHHRRTRSFGGTPEVEAVSVPVRLTIAYDADGTIRAYRNGQPYGNPYRKADLIPFETKQTQVVFGLRHGTGVGGNRMLRGRVLEAKLFDWALTPDDVAASSHGRRYVSDSQVMAALTERQKADWQLLGTRIHAFEARLKLHGQPARENQAWIDLAHSIFNLKEFIYVR